MLSRGATAATSAAAVGTALEAGAVGHAFAMLEAAVCVDCRQPLAGDVLAHGLAVGDVDLPGHAGEEVVAVTPSLIVEAPASIPGKDALPGLSANCGTIALSAATAAAIGTANLAHTIRGYAVGYTLTLGRAPGPGGAFAAGTAAAIGATLLARTNGAADQLALVLDTLFTRQAIAAASAATVVTAILARADGHTGFIALEVLAAKAIGTSPAIATTAVVAAVLVFALGYADGAEPLRSASFAVRALAAETIASIRSAFLVLALRLTDWPALEIPGTLRAFGAIPAGTATAVITTEFPLALRRAAAAAVGQAGFTAGTVPTASPATVIAADLVDTIRHADVGGREGITGVGKETVVLGHRVGRGGHGISIAARGDRVASIRFGRETEAVFAAVLAGMAAAPEELPVVGNGAADHQPNARPIQRARGGPKVVAHRVGLGEVVDDGITRAATRPEGQYPHHP